MVAWAPAQAYIAKYSIPSYYHEVLVGRILFTNSTKSYRNHQFILQSIITIKLKYNYDATRIYTSVLANYEANQKCINTTSFKSLFELF